MKEFAKDIPNNFGVNTLSLKGGYINYEEHRFINYEEKDFPTNLLEVEFKQEAYDEHVDKFLKEVQPDLLDRQLLSEMLGYILFDKTNKRQKAFIMLGNGSNGKSTYFDMLIDFLGDKNVSSVELQNLNQKHQNVDIYGKKLNICDDLENHMITSTGNVKSVISGGRMMIDPKYVKPFS